ncbi:hypothetical protein E2C01_080995 [Portunus trituberculatus]|uniref:Uncharacterized protein n=1 Tax=Portunus trituberculatus TaxID=210409 RepID=A0A5B7IVG0_PORTR|nr:hypothetical protein [Portunus trituberculatus]
MNPYYTCTIYQVKFGRCEEAGCSPHSTKSFGASPPPPLVFPTPLCCATLPVSPLYSELRAHRPIFE